MDKTKHLGARLALGFVAASAAVLAIVLCALRPTDARHIGAATALLILSLVAYRRYRRLSLDVYTSLRRSSHRSFTLKLQDVFDSAEDLTCHMGVGEALYLIDSLAWPHKVNERITESVEPLIRSVQVTTGVTVRLPRYQIAGGIVVPLLMQRRGQLADGLTLRGPDERRLSSLSHVAMVTHLTSAFRVLIATLGPDALLRYRQGPEADATLILSSDRPVPSDLIDGVIGRIRLLGRQGEDEAVTGRLAACLRALRTGYPLACYYRVPAEDMFRGPADKPTGLPIPTARFTVRRRIIPNLNVVRRPGLGRFLWARDHFRAWMGVNPSSVSFPLANADRAASYHLEVRGHAGAYLARQEVTDGATGRRADLNGVEYRMQERRGQRLAHLYLRRGSGFASKYFEATFFERMPGSVGPAALAAVAVAILSTVMGFNALGVGGSKQSDLVAVLLAFPTVAALWSGFGQSATLVGGTLAARVTALLTIAVALAASATYVLTNQGSSADGDLTWARAPGLGRWILICGLAWLIASGAVLSYFIRVHVEEFFARRRPENER